MAKEIHMYVSSGNCMDPNHVGNLCYQLKTILDGSSKNYFQKDISTSISYFRELCAATGKKVATVPAICIFERGSIIDCQTSPDWEDWINDQSILFKWLSSHGL